MEQIVQLITTNGMGVVLLAYFIFKDYKFNQNILTVLDKMNTILAKLETWHCAEAGNNEHN